jgi:hypothetical protein
MAKCTGSLGVRSKDQQGLGVEVVVRARREGRKL